MLVRPNQKQISKPLSVLPQGPITAPISLLCTEKFPKCQYLAPAAD